MIGEKASSLKLFRLLQALLLHILIQCAVVVRANPQQKPLHRPTAMGGPLFLSLERLARLVDTSYCLGSTGIHRPFECLSRCKEFPELELVSTWSTGVLLGDSCGFIALDRGEEAIMVAFRGTYSIANTIVDLTTMPQKYVPYPSPDRTARECANCTVHMGFLHSWRSARTVVLRDLVALRAAHPTYAVHLVGHSLGGSVACLAALELRVSLGWEDVTVTTFGEPRVGNEGLARFVDDVFNLSDAHGEEDPERRKYRRVTHADDPVPLLPPTEFGFKSHAGEVFISKSSLSPTEEDVWLCTGDEDARCSAGADGSVWAETRETVGIPTRFRLWQILTAHRDYFWRLGLCVPGGDPTNWGRSPYDQELAMDFTHDGL